MFFFQNDNELLLAAALLEDRLEIMEKLLGSQKIIGWDQFLTQPVLNFLYHHTKFENDYVLTKLLEANEKKVSFITSLTLFCCD